MSALASVIRSQKKYETAVRVKVAGFFMNADKTDLWMSTANPLLGGVSPMQMIRWGCGARLLKFVENQLKENTIMKEKATAAPPHTRKNWPSMRNSSPRIAGSRVSRRSGQRTLKAKTRQIPE